MTWKMEALQVEVKPHKHSTPSARQQRKQKMAEGTTVRCECGTILRLEWYTPFAERGYWRWEYVPVPPKAAKLSTKRPGYTHVINEA